MIIRSTPTYLAKYTTSHYRRP